MIWLDVFTLGFLVTVLLTVFRLDLIFTMEELYWFNILLAVILILRAVINYYIGKNVYFPWPAPESKSSQPANVEKADLKKKKEDYG